MTMTNLAKRVVIPAVIVLGISCLLLIDWAFGLGFRQWASEVGVYFLLVPIALCFIAAGLFILPLAWARLNKSRPHKSEEVSGQSKSAPEQSDQASGKKHDDGHGHPHKETPWWATALVVLLIAGLLAGGYYYWTTTKDIPVSQTGSGCDTSGYLELPAGRRSEPIESQLGCRLVPISVIASSGKLEYLDGSTGRWILYSPVMNSMSGDYRKWRLTAGDKDVAISYGYIPG